MCADRVATSQSPKETWWKSIKGKASHAARKDAPAKEKENVRARAKEKARGDVLDHVSCARDLTGLVIVFHIMVERASVSTPLGKGHKNSSPFRQAYLEGDKHDWITGAGAFAVSVPSLQNFASLDLYGKFILDSGATDLLQRIQEMYAQAGLRLTSYPVSPLRFSFANGQEDVSTSVLPVPYLPWKVIFTFVC